jgi:hypothetical protein
MRRLPNHPLVARPCICGKHMFERANEGICLWCGHGLARAVSEHAYRRNMVAIDPALDRRLFAEEGESNRHLSRTFWTSDRCVEAAREWESVHGRLPSSADWAAAGNGHPSFQTINRVFGGMVAFRCAIADVPREWVAA